MDTDSMTAHEAIVNLNLKFSSGNDIPIRRATITIGEWTAILPILEMFETLGLTGAGGEQDA